MDSRIIIRTPTRGVAKLSNCLWKTGGCLWTLCKTIIGFSPEYLECIPNVATADETGNPKDE
ncbi:hypothetical protein [Microseira wollei]|uniref:hypothetical protein n=1 Tax=Microseira wollei TaxID=467598 RepID=UPI001CFED1C8|nr:hypothetical protein [Microseira wollei]